MGITNRNHTLLLFAGIFAMLARQGESMIYVCANTRTIRIEMQTTGNYLCISQILATTVSSANVAFNKSTTASPVNPSCSYAPSNAVDGVIRNKRATNCVNPNDRMYHSQVKTAANSVYWEVNLGASYDITNITYYNRNDSCGALCQNWFSGAIIKAIDASGTTQCYWYGSGALVQVFDAPFPTSAPTQNPTRLPTQTPSKPTFVPTAFPSTASPTVDPTFRPSVHPSAQPSTPSSVPTIIPSTPSSVPTIVPSTPSSVPTIVPSTPSSVPTTIPSRTPSVVPTTSTPTADPSRTPSAVPVTRNPTADPSKGPSTVPSSGPTNVPTSAPATGSPTKFRPTLTPSYTPTYSTPQVANRFCAVLNPKTASGASGHFGIEITNNTARYWYHFELNNLTTTCDLSKGIKYHIHSYWKYTDKSYTSSAGSTSCGRTYLGGHFDPQLACSSASNELTSCTALGRASANYGCNVHDYRQGYYDACELGDLSSKHETVGVATMYPSKIFSSFNVPIVDQNPPYVSAYNLANGKGWTSLVIHCGTSGTPIACAKLVRATEGSVCAEIPHPPVSVDPYALTADEKNEVINNNNTAIALIVICVGMIAIIYAYLYMKFREEKEAEAKLAVKRAAEEEAAAAAAAAAGAPAAAH